MQTNWPTGLIITKSRQIPFIPSAEVTGVHARILHLSIFRL